MRAEINKPPRKCARASALSLFWAVSCPALPHSSTGAISGGRGHLPLQFPESEDAIFPLQKSPLQSGWRRVCSTALVDHQIAPPQTRKAKGNSPHPKRGSRKVIRPTSKRAYYCTFIEPTPKVRILRSSGRALRKVLRGPGFKSGHFLANYAPLNSFSPHSYRNCPHQCTIGDFQQSVRKSGGPIGSLPDSL